MVNKKQADFVDEIESVHSHPHALAQCHKYLLYHFRNVPLIQTTSTAAAAKYISENPDEKVAAIGNSLRLKSTVYILPKKKFMIFISTILGLLSCHFVKAIR